jgi:hypothetical protein
MSFAGYCVLLGIVFPLLQTTVDVDAYGVENEDAHLGISASLAASQLPNFLGGTTFRLPRGSH